MQVPNDFCCLSINKNIFMKDFTEYKYRIYSYSDCGPNTNIEYIRCSQLVAVPPAGWEVRAAAVNEINYVLCGIGGGGGVVFDTFLYFMDSKWMQTLITQIWISLFDRTLFCTPNSHIFLANSLLSSLLKAYFFPKYFRISPGLLTDGDDVKSYSSLWVSSSCPMELLCHL